MQLLKLTLILTILAASLSACASHKKARGIASLGKDFVRAFSQDANAEPLEVDQSTLRLTPRIEPFNP